MKKILFAICLFPALLFGQEQTIETLDIFSRTDTVICEGDTIAPIFFQVIQTTTDNGTDYPNTRIDTLLYQNGNCPADSLEVLRQLEVQAEEYQNRASKAMSDAFQKTRRGQAVYSDIRTLYNNFTGSEIRLKFEDKFFSRFEGVYKIIDVQDNLSSVKADMIRIGADDRYRLEVQAGQPGAGTRYTVWPLSRTSFEVRGWTPAGGVSGNYYLALDRNAELNQPVYRENGYIEGGAEDALRVKKIE